MLENGKLNKFKEKYKSDKNNIVRNRMLNKVPLIDLIADIDTDLNVEFNINIKTHGVTDQQTSGRCWAFAGLNILREKIIDNCKLDNFELSGSYIAFYDKLERFNMLLERLILYKKEEKDLYDRHLSSLLNYGLLDGGYFTQLANLVKKYGVVPQNVFPESFQSSNTYEVNQILSRLLRKFYLELENCSDEFDFLKDKYLEYAYNIITSIYGMPPEKFNFEYTDKDGKYFIDKNITPKQFYDKYIGINLFDDYIEIASYQDEKFKYNNIYQIEETSRISGTEDNVVLNITSQEVLELILKQLKDNEPVYFYSSTTSKRISGIWLDTMERYGDIFGIDLTLDKNDILKTNGVTNEHCMLITGVNIIDDKPIKWKIENSWGSNSGKNGYWIATNDWMDKYIVQVVINKKHFSKNQLECLKQEPIKIEKFDNKLG